MPYRATYGSVTQVPYFTYTPAKFPKLDYAEVISYSLLGEFSLLKHSCYEVLEKPWALPDNHEMMKKYYKLQ
ncbi:hypothetical protein PISMIDRAFT_118796 [Pisolithus microcarpus 441]|uniref:Uncharacterized protein n=1 Tax=Pisolithus microcarpus 441 TaxID=765257 RepID=A0A0C9Z0E8_9AGAM|nr:hypothetical protein BKA83DRAFT_118796 [Pisolithus microcarpus]KIK13483.1 hypothetical protein PISMIDRAFT_118796 [Pisolithus microcarpus 441]